MFSIVIPLYNKEKYIGKTLESVLKQTFTAFEVLIVNDGSTDVSAEIVKGYNDDRIQLIEIENSGVSVARNTGIKHAKYDWVAFLDGDDWWSTHFLEEINLAINTYTERSIFATGRSLVYKDCVSRYYHEYLPEDGKTAQLNYIKTISKALPLVNSSNSVIKKQLFKEKGVFKPGVKRHEDHDLWLRLSVGEPVVFINKELSFYLKVEAISASTSYYLPSDFASYLETLMTVKMKISEKEKPYFQQYCNRFVLLSYIINYKKYSKAEDKMVYAKAKKLLTGSHLMALNTLKLLPFKDVYSILKFLKG